jgi:hypothetical protein
MSDIKILVVHSDMKPDQLADAIAKFGGEWNGDDPSEEGKAIVLIIDLQLFHKGFNLQVAGLMIFRAVPSSWGFAANAIARMHRNGQENTAQALYLVNAGHSGAQQAQTTGPVPIDHRLVFEHGCR